MKKNICFILFTAFYLMLVSCGDDAVNNSVKPDSKTNPGIITVQDKISGKNLEGYRIEIFQLTEGSDFYKTKRQMEIFPNPFNKYGGFLVKEIEKSSKIEISATNLLTLNQISLCNEKSDTTFFVKYINFSDSINIESGIYKAFVKVNGNLTDSLNFMCFSNNLLLSPDKKLYFLGAYTTNDSGNITAPKYLSNLINENMLITAEDGLLLSGFKLENHVKIYVFDKELNKVAETYTTIEIIKDMGLLVKI